MGPTSARGIQSDVTDLVNRDGFAPAEIKKRHGEELRGRGPGARGAPGQTMGKPWAGWW